MVQYSSNKASRAARQLNVMLMRSARCTNGKAKLIATELRKQLEAKHERGETIQT